MPGAWKIAVRGSGLRWQTQVFVFCLACLLIVSHRPDAVRNAQFYAEDGAVWFAQAYNFGWLHSLLLQQNGYLQTLPRLAAGLGLLVPLRWAPLAMNLVGITLQALPAILLLSRRLANWGPLPLRACWALAYLVLPNVMELEATVTEGQWHLALLACLVILAEPPAPFGWLVFDVAVLLVCGLTGPFCLVLLPVGLLYWYLRRPRRQAVFLLLLTLASLLQFAAVIRTAAVARSQAPLGVTPQLFLQLVAGRVYMAALWGDKSLAAQQHLFLLVPVMLLGTGFLIYVLLKAILELRLLIIFCFVIFGLSLAHPMASYVQPQWEVLSIAAGQHYWFLPMVAFIWSLVWCCFCAPSAWICNIAKLLLLTMPVGISDWRYPPYKDMGYSGYVQQFKTAQTASFRIPLFPVGWEMVLIKASSACPMNPKGYIDAPKSGATVSGTVTVSGWVIAPGQHVRTITVEIDRQPLPSFHPQKVRTDVDGLYPDSPDKEKGWVTYFDASRLRPGKHHIEVIATEESGCTAEIGQLTIQSAR